MRALPFVLLLAACGSSSAGRAGDAPAAAPRLETDRPVRVVYRQYYKDSNIFIMENLGGRDIVKLRSRKLERGESPIAYVPDDVMKEMLREFERIGYHRYAGPRPRNPIQFGATGEITVIDEQRRMKSLLRKKLPLGQEPAKEYVQASQTYIDCSKTYLAVWDHFRPQAQATVTRGNFGVKRAEFERE